jgi:hypothetical protein
MCSIAAQQDDIEQVKSPSLPDEAQPRVTGEASANVFEDNESMINTRQDRLTRTHEQAPITRRFRTPEEWEDMKSIIRELYLQRDWPLKEVITHMGKEHNSKAR